jgi:hypothetical protein
MDFVLSLRKSHLFFAGFLVLVVSLGIVFAYQMTPGANRASIAGHSIDEINWNQLGTCSEGYAIRQINNDGTVVCQQINNTQVVGGTEIIEGGNSAWIVSGGNVYRLSGNVGIGTPTPTSKLHINGGKLTVSQEGESIALDVLGNKFIRFKNGAVWDGYAGIVNGRLDVVKQGSGDVYVGADQGNVILSSSAGKDILLNSGNRLCLKGECISTWADITPQAQATPGITGLSYEIMPTRIVRDQVPEGSAVQEENCGVQKCNWWFNEVKASDGYVFCALSEVASQKLTNPECRVEIWSNNQWVTRVHGEGWGPDSWVGCTTICLKVTL